MSLMETMVSGAKLDVVWSLNSCLGMLEYTGLLLLGRCVCDMSEGLDSGRNSSAG